MIHKSSIYLILISACIISSIFCKDKGVHIGESGMVVKVLKSSGDDYSYEFANEEVYFAPYPFNFSHVSIDGKEYDVCVISKKLNKGDHLEINPVAKMTLRNGDHSMTDVIIAYPVNEQLRNLNINSFYDFTVVHFSYKQIVEYWYLNRNGLQGTEVLNWKPFTLTDFKPAHVKK